MMEVRALSKAETIDEVIFLTKCGKEEQQKKNFIHAFSCHEAAVLIDPELQVAYKPFFWFCNDFFKYHSKDYPAPTMERIKKRVQKIDGLAEQHCIYR